MALWKQAPLVSQPEQKKKNLWESAEIVQPVQVGGDAPQDSFVDSPVQWFNKAFEGRGDNIVLGAENVLKGADLVTADFMPDGAYEFDAGVRNVLSKALPDGWIDKAPETRQDFIDQTIEDIQGNQDQMQANIPDDLTDWQKGLGSAVESTPITLGSIGLSLINPALGVAGFTGYEGLGSYGEARTKGKGKGQALVYGTVNGAIEGWTERLGLKPLFRVFDKSGAGKDLAEYVAKEYAGEQLATLGQSLNAYAHKLDEVLNDPNLTFDEKMQAQTERQKITAMATTFMTGATVTAKGVANAHDAIKNKDKPEDAEMINIYENDDQAKPTPGAENEPGEVNIGAETIPGETSENAESDLDFDPNFIEKEDTDPYGFKARADQENLSEQDWLTKNLDYLLKQDDGIQQRYADDIAKKQARLDELSQPEVAIDETNYAENLMDSGTTPESTNSTYIEPSKLVSMKKDELQDMAKQRGVHVSDKATKSELMDAIGAQQNSRPSKPVEPIKPTVKVNKPVTNFMKSIGIHPDSQQAQDLKSQDINSRTVPGLFRRPKNEAEAQRGVDNIPLSEFAEATGVQPEGDGTYVDPEWITQQLTDENNDQGQLSEEDQAKMDAYERDMEYYEQEVKAYENKTKRSDEVNVEFDEAQNEYKDELDFDNDKVLEFLGRLESVENVDQGRDRANDQKDQRNALGEQGGDSAGQGATLSGDSQDQQIQESRQAVDLDTTPEDTETSTDEPTQPLDKIEDFGEKIGGARKDTYVRFAYPDVDADMREVPLSQSFPKPNYKKLIKEGVDPKSVVYVAMLRNEIPTKPRKSWALSRWIGQAESARDTSIAVFDSISFDEYLEGEHIDETNRPYIEVVNLADKVDADKVLELEKYRFNDKERFSMFNGEENVWKYSVKDTSKGKSFGGMGSHEYFDTKQEALDWIVDQVNAYDSSNKSKKKIKFEVWTKRGQTGYFVGKKVASGKFITLKTLDSKQEAFDYIRDNHDLLVDLLEKEKSIHNVRGEENNPRVGENYRKGKDVTPKLFGDTFGFRGVEFGNWVEGSKRQESLNNAYDGLLDMANLLGIPPKAISLNGDLGLAFGSRGRKGASAHYEPGKVVINLTKKSGAGSLAHEWWHAVDNYFAKMESSKTSDRKNQSSEYLSESKGRVARIKDDGMYRDAVDSDFGVRREVYDAFVKLTKAIKKETNLLERAKRQDKTKTKDYWSTVREMTARSFERYVIDKLKSKGYSSDYLANVVSQNSWKGFEGTLEKYQYPLDEEMDVVNNAYDNLFDILETKETDKGVALFQLKKNTNARKDQKQTEVSQDKDIQALADSMAETFQISAEEARNQIFDGRLGMRSSERQRLEKLFKRRIKAFRVSENLDVFDGVFITENPDVIYINEDTKEVAKLIAGHEMLHAMRYDRPDLYDDLLSALDPIVKDLDAHRDSLNEIRRENSLEDLDYDLAKEELVADFVGENWTTEEFWNKVSVEGGMFKKIVAWVKRWLKKIDNWFTPEIKSTGLGKDSINSKHLMDELGVITAQDAIAKAMRQYIKSQKEGGVTKKPTKDNGVRFSLNEGLDSDFSKAIDKIWAGEHIDQSRGNVQLGTTPKVFSAIGIADLPVTMNYSKLSRVMDKHLMTPDLLKQIPKQLNNPVMVFENKDHDVDNSYVILTDLQDYKGDTITVYLHVKRESDGYLVNKIASIYGRGNNKTFVKSHLMDGNLLYADTQKSHQVMAQLQLPSRLLNGFKGIITEKNLSSNQTRFSIKRNKAENTKQKGSNEDAESMFDSITSNEGIKSVKGVGHTIGRFMYFAPHNIIRNSIGTETAKKLADIIYRDPDNKSSEKGIDDIVSKRFSKLGEFSTRLTKILDPHKNRVGGLKKALNPVLIKALNTGSVPKKLESTARELRAWLDDIVEYQKEAGVDIGYVKNYFPRVYDVEILLKNKNKFIKMLEKNGYKKGAEDIYNKIVLSDGAPELLNDESERVSFKRDGGLFIPGARVGEHLTTKAVKSGFQKERVLDIDFSELEPFLIDDVTAVLSRYMNLSIKRTEYVRAFGANEGKLNSMVSKIMEEFDESNADMDKEQALKVIYDMADSLQGIYNPIKTPALHRLNRLTLNAGIMIHLPRVVLSSIPETFTVGALLNGSHKAVLKGLYEGVKHGLNEASAVTQRLATGKRTMSKTEATQYAEEIGVVTHQALMDAIGAQFGTKDSKATNVFMKATMLETLTRMQKISAIESFKFAVKDWSTKLDDHSVQQLGKWGISKEEAKQWADDNFSQDSEVATKVASASQRFAIRAITTPTEATRSFGLQDQRLAIFFQFQSFINTFSNTFLKAVALNFKDNKGLHKMDSIPYLVLMVALAYAMQGVRDEWKYGKNEKPYENSKLDRWINAIDRAGLTGQFQTLFNMFRPYKYGYSDSSAKRAFYMLGPVVNDIGKILDVGISKNKDKGLDQKTKKLIQKITPVLNAIPQSSTDKTLGIDR